MCRDDKPFLRGAWPCINENCAKLEKLAGIATREGVKACGSTRCLRNNAFQEAVKSRGLEDATKYFVYSSAPLAAGRTP